MRLETIHLESITLRKINQNGYQRYCVNITDAAKLLHVTAPTITDKVNRGTLPIWKKEERESNSYTWIPLDAILEKTEIATLPEDLQILVNSGKLKYDPYLALIEMLLHRGSIKWYELDTDIQKKLAKIL